jgi:hypothetical protein
LGGGVMKRFLIILLLCTGLSACTPKNPQEELRGMLATPTKRTQVPKIFPLAASIQKAVFHPIAARRFSDETPFYSRSPQPSQLTKVALRSEMPERRLVQDTPPVKLQEEPLVGVVPEVKPVVEESQASSQELEEDLENRLTQLFFDQRTPTSNDITVESTPYPPITPLPLARAGANGQNISHERWITLSALLLGLVMLGAPIGCYFHIRYLREHRDL